MEEHSQPDSLCPRQRISSSCSTTVPPPSRPSSTCLVESAQRRPRRPTTSKAAGWPSRVSASERGSTSLSEPSLQDENSSKETREEEGCQLEAAHGQLCRPDIARRQGCGLGPFLDAICRLLFRSDLVEYNLDSLQRLAHLGHGTFGKVSLVWCPVTSQCLALKAVSKGLVAERKLQSAVRTEKMIMKRLDSPFLTKLAATFSRGQHLYMLMEAVRGGDLHETYIWNDFWGSKEHARFYTACMVGGLKYLHECHIIYRDLKMENIVIDARGYAKLCDFGLSRFLWPAIGSAYTICGTPEYKAPEIDKRGGYGIAVDWWALGILLYEVMVGMTPFLAESPALIRSNALAGIDRIIPEGIELAWAKLARALCRPEPNQRLPLLKGGIVKLMEHEWFQQPALDWESLRACRMVAPYIPELDGPTDIGHFNSKTGLAEDTPYRYTESDWDIDYEDPIGPRFADESEAT